MITKYFDLSGILPRIAFMYDIQIAGLALSTIGIPWYT